MTSTHRASEKLVGDVDTGQIESVHVRYLDLTGDGTPDAVERVTRRSIRGRDLGAELVEETRRLAFGIGIDGKPTGVREQTGVLLQI
ncbi:MAG TPA: hypothetical protein VM282_13165 [Acidimicrobiales bacterium]|nr:hypothetical protein [Acidimicrobiales bacterium]